MMRSKHTAIILGKLALLEYRDLKTALNQKSVRKNSVISGAASDCTKARNKLYLNDKTMKTSGIYLQIKFLNDSIKYGLFTNTRVFYKRNNIGQVRNTSRPWS